MKLIFFRHGIAEKKHVDDTLMDDFNRRLTKEGIIEVKEMVQSGSFIFRKMDNIFTSPLVRAVQTAEVLYRQCEKCEFDIMPELDSVSPLADFQNALKKLPNGTYCFVGHEPHLTSSVNLLLNGKSESEIDLAKGGVLILEGSDLDHLKISLLVSPRAITKFEY